MVCPPKTTFCPPTEKLPPQALTLWGGRNPKMPPHSGGAEPILGKFRPNFTAPPALGGTKIVCPPKSWGGADKKLPPQTSGWRGGRNPKLPPHPLSWWGGRHPSAPPLWGGMSIPAQLLFTYWTKIGRSGAQRTPRRWKMLELRWFHGFGVFHTQSKKIFQISSRKNKGTMLKWVVPQNQ